MVLIKYMISDCRKCIRQGVFIPACIDQIHRMEPDRQLHLVVIYMFPVFGKPGDDDRSFPALYGVNDRAGTAMGNQDAARFKHLRKLFPAVEGLTTAMGRDIVSGACLDEDLLRNDPV